MTIYNAIVSHTKRSSNHSRAQGPVFVRGSWHFFFFTGLFFLLTVSAASQGLVEIINQTERAVIQGVAYGAEGVPADSSMGFFISADGLAIIPSSLLHTGELVQFRDYSGSRLRLKKIVAIHPYAGLVMIQMSNFSDQKHSYLIPSNPIVAVKDNILAFGMPQGNDNGLFYSSIESSFFQMFIGRGTLISSKVQRAFHGTPVINEGGRFSGILHYLPAFENALVLPLTVLADTLWVSVDQTYEEFLQSPQRILYAHQGIVQGLLYQSTGQWVESAKAFSRYLKDVSVRSDLYALRAISRLNYDNTAGCRDDIERAFYIDPASYLAAYANALYHLKNKSVGQAEDQLKLSLGTNPQFAPAFLELGKLQLASDKIEEAYFSFSKAIEADSLLAEAWYEKARLSQQYSADQTTGIRELQTAARLNPYLPGVFSLIGIIKVNAHDYLDAIRDFNKALVVDPGDGHAYMNRGLAWYNVGMKENACKDWESAGKAGMSQAFKLLSRHCSEVRKGFLQNR